MEVKEQQEHVRQHVRKVYNGKNGKNQSLKFRGQKLVNIGLDLDPNPDLSGSWTR